MSNITDIRNFQTIAAPQSAIEENEDAFQGIEIIKAGCDLCDKIFSPNGICLFMISMVGLFFGAAKYGFGLSL